MAYQTIFQRYEMKYRLDRRQKQAILAAMRPYMQLDEYGRTTIRNIYYDTDNFRLIRRSLEKPAYKEKLRVRSYRQVCGQDDVFVELKKKYQSVVYKRRLTISEEQARTSFQNGWKLPVQSQIAEEIQYFRDYYASLRPVVFLSYEREAYFEKNGGDFRVTFDENIRYRTDDLSLRSAAYGTPILEQGETLMEIKTSGGLPLWMVRVLSEQGIFKTSFSKYGTAYQNMTEQNKQRRYRYA